MKTKFFGGASSVLLLFLATTLLPAVPLQRLHGHIPGPANHLQPLRLLPATNRLNLAIALPLRNEAALSQLINQIYDPASPHFHHYLTSAQFTTEFGPSEQDYQAVIAFAQRNGLRVTATYSNHGLVDVNGSVADIERVLHLKLNVYHHPTENRTFYAPSAEPSLDLSVPILHIGGLDNYELPRPCLATNRLIQGQNLASPAAGSGPGGAYMGKDFRTAYVPDSSLNGSGQAIGLLEFDGYSASDIHYYENAAGLPNVPMQDVLIDGATAGTEGSEADVEVALDIEVAIAMATNAADVVVYQAPNGSPFEDILNHMVTNTLVTQFSCSWYVPEGTAQPAADQIWMQMAAQGQSFFNASGDGLAWVGLIYFPGDSPYITQVGGTTLTTSGPGGAWASETVWNQGNGGSGGGISTQYPIPSWQTNISMAANQGSTTMRNTPDVAMTAENVYVRVDGGNDAVGGTSCAAPLWAGFAALANQQAAASGKSPIGLINAAVDAIGTSANYTSDFHDITTGNNTWSGSPTKFYAVPGYDLCTGWGTPAGQKLINALANPEALIITPATGFTSTGGVGGPFTVTSQELSLTNVGSNTLTWTLSNTSVWLNVSSSGGTLAPNSPATMVAVSLNNTASNLAIGTYNATLWFTNSNDSVGQSRQFFLNVIAPPSITTQPTNQAVLEGAPAVFNVSATGGLPLAYQWQFDGTNLTDSGNISGSLTTNLVVSDVLSNDLGNYNLVVSNFAGVVVSSNAALTIISSAPVIVQQPTNETVSVEQTVFFNVTAYGNVPLAYQWTYDGTNIVGATNSLLTLTNVQLNQTGTYAVLVTNNYGSILSSNAALTVQVAALVGYWPFNEGSGTVLHDLINGNNGTIYNGTWSSGISGSDLAFNGSSTYVGIPSMANLNFGTGSFSLSVWFNGGGQHNEYPAILSNNPGGWESGCFALRWQNLGRSDFTIHWNPEGDPILDSGTLNQQQWYNAVVIRNGTNLSLYIDAVLTATASVSATDPINLGNGGTMLLGGNTWDGGNSYYLGSLEQLRLYQGILTPQQITNLYTIIAPPVITNQPQSQAVFAGSAVTFNVGVSSSVPPCYQWQFNGTNIIGATNATYTISSVAQNNAGNYAVTVINALGSAISSNAVLTVYAPTPPVITTQPTNQTVAVGGTASFSVTASGQLLTYQWAFDGTNIMGATNTMLTLTNVQLSQAGIYAVLVTNLNGSATSSNVMLTVYGIPPVITMQPTNQTVAVGGMASFSVMASGTSPLAYQWTYDGTNIVGATNTLLTLTNVQLSQAGNYAVLVTNLFGPATSSNAVLAVYAFPPVITTQPTNQAVAVGGTASFSVTASGTSPLAYQWTYDGTNIVGATNSLLTLTNVQLNQTGTYAVLVTNNYGSILSSNAALTVQVAALVGYWPFNEGSGTVLHDLINGNNGTIYNGTWSSGISGSDLAFNGSSTYVGIPSMANLNFGTGSFSLSVWFNGGGQHNEYPAILSNNPGGWESGCFALRWQNLGRSDFTIHWNPEGDPILDSGTLNQQQWYNAVVIRNGTNLSLYIDAVLTATASVSATDPINLGNGGTMLLGGNTWDGGNSYYLGSLEQLRLYQGILTPQQITNLYTIIAPPVITNQPQSQAVFAGSAVTFNVGVSSSVPPCYQWQFNGTNIIGATNATYTISSVAQNNAGNYAVTVINALGSAISSNAVLTVYATPPAILTQPTNQTVSAASSATFSVTASGPPPLSYQWNFNNTNAIYGATNSILTLTNVQSANAGFYSVTVTNLYGSATSSNAILVVTVDHFAWNTIPSPRFLNTPFSVEIVAQNATNGIYTNYTGMVLINSTNGLPVSPTITSNFVQGIWTGTITVSQTASNLVLSANDRSGHAGLANPINIVNLPQLTTVPSGQTLLISWPESPSGFVLETCTNVSSPNWVRVSTSPITLGGQYVLPITLPGTNACAFYRLYFTGP